MKISHNILEMIWRNKPEGLSLRNNSQDTLTLEKLRDMIDLIYPPLYFATDKNLDKDCIYKFDSRKMKKRDFLYFGRIHDVGEFIVFHPYHLQELATVFPNRLIHIRDYGKEDNE